MRPLIIVSPSVTDDLEEIKLSRVCFRAVEAAGGLALAADYFRADELAERADGILLSGGGDIEPSLSGDEPDREHRGFICLERDRFELELVKRAAKKGIPILGNLPGRAGHSRGFRRAYNPAHRRSRPKCSETRNVPLCKYKKEQLALRYSKNRKNTGQFLPPSVCRRVPWA